MRYWRERDSSWSCIGRAAVHLYSSSSSFPSCYSWSYIFKQPPPLSIISRNARAWVRGFLRRPYKKGEWRYNHSFRSSPLKCQYHASSTIIYLPRRWISFFPLYLFLVFLLYSAYQEETTWEEEDIERSQNINVLRKKNVNSLKIKKE